MGYEKNSILEEMIKAQKEEPAHYLSAAALERIAAQYHLTVWQVLDAATFYRDISLKPRGRHIIKVCKSPCCHFSGEQRLLPLLEEILGIEAGQTTDDGIFTLEETSCLGACDKAPSALIDGHLYGFLDEALLRSLLAQIKERER